MACYKSQVANPSVLTNDHSNDIVEPSSAKSENSIDDRLQSSVRAESITYSYPTRPPIWKSSAMTQPQRHLVHCIKILCLYCSHSISSIAALWVGWLLENYGSGMEIVFQPLCIWMPSWTNCWLENELNRVISSTSRVKQTSTRNWTMFLWFKFLADLAHRLNSDRGALCFASAW